MESKSKATTTKQSNKMTTKQNKNDDDMLNIVKATSSRLRSERDSTAKKMNTLFNIINEYGGEKAIREAFKALNHPVRFEYYAIQGEREYKKGVSKVWLSATGKYQGKYREEGVRPVCNGYIPYNELPETDFKFNKDVNELFLYGKTTILYNGVEVEVHKINFLRANVIVTQM